MLLCGELYSSLYMHGYSSGIREKSHNVVSLCSMLCFTVYLCIKGGFMELLEPQLHLWVTSGVQVPLYMWVCLN